MSFQPGAVLNTQAFGNRAEGVEVPVLQTRAPTAQDTGGAISYPIGKRWIDQVGNNPYTLCSLSSSNGVITATWTLG